MDYKKVRDFVVEAYIPYIYNSSFKNIGYQIINTPKEVIAYVKWGFYLEYLYKLVEGKISLEKFVYLGDVVKKRNKLVNKKRLILESLFCIYKDLKMGKRGKYQNKYIIVCQDAEKYFSLKFDINFLREQFLELNTKIFIL